MNFFEHQEQARKRTGRLVLLYGLAVVLIIIAIYAVVLAVFAASLEGSSARPLNAACWNPALLFWVAVCALVIIGGGTLFKIRMLAGGGAVVARMLGGIPVNPNTRDLHERRVLNVVEEMALASGTPVPPVYILPDETCINAFAAGFSPRDAVIGVTLGSVRLLTRDELQGVIAHEFSHILNGDMRLNIRLMGVLHGILLIALIGYWVMRVALRSGGRGGGSSSRGGKKGNGGAAFALLGLGLMIVGYIGVFFAKLIKSAVSRQREFLADASSVQFTRNPGGLAGALKKIAGYSAGSRLQSPLAEEASHLYFANGLRSAFLGLMATHPPIIERIRRIAPDFDGALPDSAGIEAAARIDRTDEMQPTARLAAPLVRPPPLPARHPCTLAQMSGNIGTLDAAHLQQASDWLAQIPDDLRQAIRDRKGAQAVAYCLVLAESQEFRRLQRDYLAKHAADDVWMAVQAHAAALETFRSSTRLSLASLALPALRTLAPDEYAVFRDNMLFLVSIDKEVNLFEYAVLRMMVRHLDPVFGRAKPQLIRHTRLRDIAGPMRTLLATLAWFGHEDASQAAEAYSKGMAQLAGIETAPLQTRASCTLDAFDQSLEHLAAATPRLKEKIIDACTACSAADGYLTDTEAEMLRAVADALHCPVPPIIAAA